MKTGKQSLLDDLLHETAPDHRPAAILAGKRLLRRKRYTRYATRALAFTAIILLAAISLRPTSVPPPAPIAATEPAPPAIPSLTDDQLLALFPDTPVGLATVGERKVLIFPRPEDRERFIGHF